MLAGDEPSFAIARIAIRIVAIRAEHADMTIVFQPTHDSIVRDVAPQQITAGGEVDRALRPAEACRDPLDACVSLAGFEPGVQRLDPRVRIAGVLQHTERERCRPPERVTVSLKAKLAHVVSPFRHPCRIVAAMRQRPIPAGSCFRPAEDIRKQRRMDSVRRLLSEVGGSEPLPGPPSLQSRSPTGRLSRYR